MLGQLHTGIPRARAAARSTQSVPDARMTMSWSRGVLEGWRISAFRRVVVVIIIVAFLTRGSSSAGFVQL